MNFWNRLKSFKPFLKYCTVGVSGTLLDLGSLYLLVEYAHLEVLVAATISFLLAVINNFTWNKTWTFKNREKNYRKQFIKFFIVSMGGLILNTGFMFLFVNIIGIWYMIAKAMTSCFVLTWNFLGNKYWTFKIKERKVEIPATFDFDLTIIIPVYNEENRIKTTLLTMADFIQEENITAEIIVVDDNSHDRTEEIVTKKQKTINNLKLLKLERNFGKGYAIKKGIEVAKGKYILFADADNSTPIEEWNKFVPYFKQGFDVIIGSRYLKGSKIKIRQPRYRMVITKIANFLVKVFLLNDIKDTQCGFKAFTHKAAKEIFSLQKVKRFAFDIEVLAIAQNAGYKIKEVPVNWYDSAESKVRLVRDSLVAFKDLVYIKLNLWSGRYG